MAKAPAAAPTSSFRLFNKSKELVLANLNTFAILLFLPFVFQMLSDINSRENTTMTQQEFDSFVSDVSPALVGVIFLFVFIFIIVNLIVTIMLYKATLDTAKGKTPQIPALWKYVKEHGVRLVLLSIVTGLIVVFGLIAFIIPGIIFIGRYYLAPYVMIDKNLSIMESLKESSRLSKPYFGKVWGILLVTILFGMFAIIPEIGWLIAFVLTALYSVAPALRYQELNKLNGK